MEKWHLISPIAPILDSMKKFWLLDFAQYLWICIHGTSDVFKLRNDLSDTLFPVTINDLQQPRAIVFLVSATSLLPLHDDVLILKCTVALTYRTLDLRSSRPLSINASHGAGLRGREVSTGQLSPIHPNRSQSISNEKRWETIKHWENNIQYISLYILN